MEVALRESERMQSAGADLKRLSIEQACCKDLYKWVVGTVYSKKKILTSSMNDKSFGMKQSFCSCGRSEKLADVNFEKGKVQLFFKKLNFSFSGTGRAHLHRVPHRHAPTAYISLQFVRADKAQVAHSKPTKSVGCLLQKIELNFEDNKVHVSEKN